MSNRALTYLLAGGGRHSPSHDAYMLVYVSEDARAGEPDARPAADARATARWEVTLDPIRCTLFVKSGGNRVLTSGQNQLFPSRGYIAETYAKLMGSSSPSQPRIKPKCTLFVC